MKFLVLSDIHGNVANIDALDGEFSSCDAVIFGGDFAAFGKSETGKPVLEKLLEKHGTIFSVIGNCDEPSFLDEIESADISVERTLAFHEGLAFAGAGGGTRFSGDTPNERDEEDILSDFSLVDSSAESCADENGKWNSLVLVMHNPPKDTDCDMIPGGIHVGSALLRSFIEKYEPVLVVTGHIHESAGISRVGSSTVVNPGSLAEGKYALVELDNAGGTWSVKSAELKSL
jgi:hypothetical protein